MKKLVFLFFFVFSSLSVFSQVNLVPNPSFEIYDTCPSNVSEIHQAIGWSAYLNSPDYFNTCAPSASNVAVPDNWVGHQFPASGNAYSGIYTCGNGDNYHEFLGTQLASPLNIGQKYFVSFKVNRCDNLLFSYSANKTGALFSTIEYSQSIPAPMNNFSHIYTNAIITDSISWTLVFGSFTADSAFEYIILGNFFDDTNTNTIGSGNQYAYYCIDDVCVSTDSLYAHDYAWTGIEEIKIESLIIYPNPADNFILLKSEGDLKGEIYILNILGQVVFNFQNNNNVEIKIDCSAWPSGVYFLKSKNASAKIIIQH